MQRDERQHLVDLAATDRDLAEEIGVGEGTLRRWIQTGRGIDRQAVRSLEFLADGELRRAALDDSGLTSCGWVESFVWPEGGSTEETLKASRELHAHSRQCSTCLQRERFLENRFGPPKTLLGPVWGTVGRVAGAVFVLPPFLRPAAAGAVLVGGVVVLRLLVSLPFLIGEDGAAQLLVEFPLAFAAALAAGASGGLAYSVTRPLALRAGQAADYISGIATVAAYMVGMAVLAPHAFGEEVFSLGSPEDVWIVGIMLVVFGLAVGHGLRTSFDQPRTPATEPHLPERRAERLKRRGGRLGPLVAGLLVVVALLLWAVWPRLTVSLAIPASIDQLEFHLSPRRFGGGPVRLGSFRLRTCQATTENSELGELVWAVDSPPGGEGAMVETVRYGIAPPGLVTVVPPQPLRPGQCYWVIHSGPDNLYIEFDGAGQGKEVSWAEAQDVTTPAGD